MARLHFKNNSILHQKIQAERANALTVKQNIDWVLSSGGNTLLAKEYCERANVMTLGQPELQIVRSFPHSVTRPVTAALHLEWINRPTNGANTDPHRSRVMPYHGLPFMLGRSPLTVQGHDVTRNT
jgi:hypothetical protein